MNNQHLVLQLRQAYIAHIKWRSTAKALNMGMPLLDKEVAVDPTECRFGKWLYGEGQLLSDNELFQHIELLHNKIHRIYKTIVYINKSKIPMSKFHIGLEDELVLIKQLQAYFKDMGKLSNEMLQTIKQLEEVLSKSPEINKSHTF